MRRTILAPLLGAVLAAAAACAGSSAPAAELERIVEVLDVRPGSRVADVGAGDGEWTEGLAEAVGDAGRVWSTEVEQRLVDAIRDRVAAAGLDGVDVILGDERSLGLTGDCCERILLRQVYHHFTEPATMRAGLRDALDRDGLLLVVEIRIQPDWPDLDGVPDRGGHGIMPDDLIEEMTADGFVVVERHERWPGDDDRYAVLFREALPGDQSPPAGTSRQRSPTGTRSR